MPGISPQKIVIVLPDKTKKIFNTAKELEETLNNIRANQSYYEVHSLVQGMLFITVKQKDAAYKKANSIFCYDFASEMKTIVKARGLDKKTKKAKHIMKDMVSRCDAIFKNIDRYDHYVVIGTINSLMAVFTGILRYNQSWIKKYSYLFNLGWSDFALLGKLTLLKKNDIPDYHLVRTLVYVDILGEMRNIAILVSMIFDIEHKRHNNNFKDFETKDFIDNPALVDEILAEKKLERESKKTRQQKMTNFIRERKLLIHFDAVPKLCQAEKSYRSLRRIKEVITKLKKYKNKKLSLVEYEAIIDLFCLLGELITPKNLSLSVKNKKSYVDWQKYIDVRNFIEHQVEKDCIELVKQLNCTKLIADLNLLENAVSEILQETLPEELIFEVVNPLKPPAPQKSTPVDKSIVGKFLPRVGANILKDFCSSEKPLSNSNFLYIEQRQTALKQLLDLLREINQRVTSSDISRGREMLANKLCDLEEEKILIDVINLTEFFKQKPNGTDLIAEFKEELKNISNNAVNKAYGKGRQPDKSFFKKLGEDIFADLKELQGFVAKCETAYTELERMKERQGQLSSRQQISWGKARDVKPVDAQRFIDVLRKIDGFDFIEQHINQNTFPSITEFKPYLDKALERCSTQEDKSFVLEMSFTLCRCKPISMFRHQMVQKAEQFKARSPNGISNKEKISIALNFVNRIRVLLHDKLHDEAFMKKVCDKIRRHRTEGFAKGYSNLSDEDFAILNKLHEKSNYKNPSEMQPEEFDQLADEYISSGLYMKLQMAAQLGAHQNKKEVIQEYIKVYEQKIYEALKEDESFDFALRYNMKQAILLLHDICNEPAFNITNYLRVNYLELIEKRNYLAHDDDYISQILDLHPSTHVIDIGRVVDIIYQELEAIDLKIKLNEQQAKTMLIPTASSSGHDPTLLSLLTVPAVVSQQQPHLNGTNSASASIAAVPKFA